MKNHMHLLKEGYAIKVEDYQDFPYMEIRDEFMPGKNYKELGEYIGIPSSSMSSLMNKRSRAYLKSIDSYLSIFDLQLVLLKGSRLYSDDLDVLHLIEGLDPYQVAKEIGLVPTYFVINRESYRIDLYLSIVEYFGLTLAVMDKGQL